MSQISKKKDAAVLLLTSLHEALAEKVDSNSPLFGDVLALSYPGILEVIAKLVPKHKNIRWEHFFLPGLWLHPKVAHGVLETVGRNRTEAQCCVITHKHQEILADINNSVNFGGFISLSYKQLGQNVRWGVYARERQNKTKKSYGCCR